MNHRWRGFAWLSLLTFLFLWADLCQVLGMTWSTNPQYAYGWTVPALALFLLWESWITRPSPVPCGEKSRRLAWLLGGIFAATLLPARLLLEATPDWRLAQWALAFSTIGLSLCAVHLMGGRAWRRHFAFPLAFILVAVPWPVKIEQSLIQTLTEWVSELTVGGLNLCAVPAIRHGSLIEISTGTVGVEEACSGVRSFQATLMAALFLGQLWNLPLRSRGLLLGAGVAFAFLCNVLRAMLLAFVAEKNGIPAIEKWHDPAGFTILGVCFVGLLGLALWLRPKSVRGLAPPQVGAAQIVPRGFVLVLGAWLVFVVAGTELWYRSAPPGTSAWWRIAWPEEQPGFAEIPFSAKVREMQFDAGRQARWRENDGTQWTAFYFRWLPGLAISRSFARWHNPDVCLTSAGFRRVAEYAPLIVHHGGLELAFRTYRFDAEARKNYVFFCVWEDREEPGPTRAEPEEWSASSHWHAVLQRKRKLGQQVFEVALSGVENEADARAAFERRVGALLEAETLPPAGFSPAAAKFTTAREP